MNTSTSLQRLRRGGWPLVWILLLYGAAHSLWGKEGPPVRSSFYDGTASSVATYAWKPQFNTAVSMTVEAWVYREEADAARLYPIISQADSFALYFLGEYLMFNRGKPYAIAAATRTVPVHQWTHVAASYDGTRVRFYVDGEIAGDFALENNGVGISHGVLLGGLDHSYFNGWIDEVRLWSVARTQADIRNNRYQEVRGAASLQAVWPEGGAHEELTDLMPVGSGRPQEAVFGILSRDLVIPETPLAATVDGVVHLGTEYKDAEQLVIRYRDGDHVRDAVAYLNYHRTGFEDDWVLQVGIPSPRDTIGGWSREQSWIGLLLDPDNSADAVAQPGDLQVQAYLGDTPSAFLVGNGSGGFVAPGTIPPGWQWNVARNFALGDVGTPSIEFSIYGGLLGSTSEPDRLAMAHFWVGGIGDDDLAPTDAVWNSPATWPQVTYGGMTELTRATIKVRVVDVATGNPIPDALILLKDADGDLLASRAALTSVGDEGKFYYFDQVAVPEGSPLTVSIDPCTSCAYEAVVISTSGIGPTALLEDRVDFPPCGAFDCEYRAIAFRVGHPPPPIEAYSFSPTNGVPGIILHDSRRFLPYDITDFDALVVRLRSRSDPVSRWLWGELSASTQRLLVARVPGSDLERPLIDQLVSDLNRVVYGGSIYDPARFVGVELSSDTLELLGGDPTGTELLRLNRLLLADAFRGEGLNGPEKVTTPTQVHITGANFHDRMKVFLYDCLDLPPTSACREGEEYIEMPVVPDSLTSSSVDVRLPRLPRFINGKTYSIVIRDDWIRAGVVPGTPSQWTHVGAPGDRFRVQMPPYPLIHGFEFRNDGEGGNWEQYTAVFGSDVYVPVLCVPRPMYAAYFPIFRLLVRDSGGSCVGMASTSLMYANRILDPGDYGARYANGLVGGPYIQNCEWLDPEELMFVFPPGPPRPARYSVAGPCPRSEPGNLWARIRRNHGVQFSHQFVTELLDQIPGHGIKDGNPVAVLNRIRANPTQFVVSMLRDGGGHAVSPYEVIDGQRFVWGTETRCRATTDGRLVDDPDSSVIRIYDNNTPGRTDRYITIDRAANRYYYHWMNDEDRKAFRYSGKRLYAFPIDLWQRDLTRVSIVRDGARWMWHFIMGDADGLHEAADGRRWGWDAEGNYIDEYPGGIDIPALHGDDTQELRTHMFLTSPDDAPVRSRINVRGSDYYFHADQGQTILQLHVQDGRAGDEDQMQVSLAGDRISAFEFTPASERRQLTPLIGMEFSDTESASFSWFGVAVGSAESARFEAVPERRAVRWVNQSGRPAHYFLQVNSADETAGVADKRVFGPFDLPGGGAQTLALEAWPSLETARLEMDTNNDGVADSSALVTSCDPSAPPEILCPSDVTAAATSPNGAVVTYEVSATDPCDPQITLTCEPPSGSLFPVGDTTVTCVAWDSAGNQSQCQFTVTVTPPPPTFKVTLANSNVYTAEFVIDPVDQTAWWTRGVDAPGGEAFWTPKSAIPLDISTFPKVPFAWPTDVDALRSFFIAADFDPGSSSEQAWLTYSPREAPWNEGTSSLSSLNHLLSDRGGAAPRLVLPVTAANHSSATIYYTKVLNNQRVLDDGWSIEVEGLGSADFQPEPGGYTGVEDTDIRASDPDTDNGANPEVFVDSNWGQPGGPARGLLRFNGLIGDQPGQVPAGAHIALATLTLYSTRNNADSPSPINLHRMLVDWNESSTWNNLGNGVTPDDVEALATPDATFVPDFTNPGGSNTQFRVIDVTASVQAWADGQANYGWLFDATGGNTYLMDSSEHANPTHHPRLEVHWGAPSEVIAFGLAHRGLGKATLSKTNDSLVVAGLTDSGLDGVRVELGEADGWAASFFEPVPLTNEGDALQSVASGWRNGNLGELGTETLDVGDGALRLTADYSSLGLSEVPVMVLDPDGQVLGQETLTNNVPLDLSAHVPAGCTGTAWVENRWIDTEGSGWQVAWTGCPPDNRTVRRTFAVATRLPLSPRRFSAVELTGRGPDQLSLSGALLSFFDHWHAALGEAQLTAGSSQLTVANIGSSGLDGVRIDWERALPPSGGPVRNVELTWLGPVENSGSSMRFESTVQVSRDGGSAEQVSLGTVDWSDTANGPECIADVSAFGAGGAHVRLYQGTSLMADYHRANGIWAARAVAWPTTYGVMPAIDAGVESPPEQVFRWSAPVLVDQPDGQPILADRLVLTADRSGLSLVAITGTDLMIGSGQTLVLSAEQVNASTLPLPPPRTYEAWAERYWPAGTPVSVTGRDEDPDGDGISNIKERVYGLDPNVVDTRGLPEPVFLEREGKRRFALRMRIPAWASDLEYRFWGTGSLTPPINWVPLNVVPLLDPTPDGDGLGLGGPTVEVFVPDLLDDIAERAHRYIRVDIGTRPPPTVEDTGESFRIGSYNVQFLSKVAYLDMTGPPDFSRPAFCCDDIENRATIIGRRIRATGYDVVAISEAFTSAAKRDLIAELAPDYPYYVRLIRGNSEVAEVLDFLTGGTERLCDGMTLSDLVELFSETDLAFWESVLDEVAPGADPTVPGVCTVVEWAGGLLSHLRKQDSGLMLFSRFPFEPLPPEAAPFRLPPDGLTAISAGAPFADVAGVIFDHAKGPDRFATKGAGWVRLRKPGSAYVHNIVFTHLNAGGQHDGVRASQLGQIRDMLLTGLGPRLDTEYVWLLGDLNINGDFTLPETGDPDDDVRDRVEWASHFNTPGQFFTEILRDVWERQCNLPWLSPAATGGRDFRDRGFTGGINEPGVGNDAMRRIDYLLMNQPASPPENEPLAVQHQAVAYGLKAFGEEEPVAFGRAGKVNLSDHYGLIADVNVREPHCQPSTALDNPPDHGSLPDMPAHVALDIRRPGGMQWVRYDTPGTYTIPNPPGTYVQVYASTDISIPVRPLPGETRILEDFNGRYAGSIFDVPQTPLFVRVRGLEDAFTGSVDLVVRRHQGAGPDDAIVLAPNADRPRVDVFTEDTIGVQVWYRLDLERADSGRAQTNCYYVQRLEGPSNYRLDLFADPAAPSLTGAEGLSRVEFCQPETGGRRLFLVVTRPESSGGPVRYEVGYSTDLTVLHGYLPTDFSTNCGPDNFEPFILCKEQSDKPDRIFGINFQDDDLVRLSLQVERASDGAELLTRPPVLLKRNWDRGKSWPRFERADEDGRFPIVRFLPDERLVVTLIEDDTIPDGLFETARAAGRLEGLTGDDDLITGLIAPLPREQFMTCPEAAVRLQDRGPLGRVRARYDFRFHLSHGVPLGER